MKSGISLLSTFWYSICFGLRSASRQMPELIFFSFWCPNDSLSPLCIKLNELDNDRTDILNGLWLPHGIPEWRRKAIWTDIFFHISCFYLWVPYESPPVSEWCWNELISPYIFSHRLKKLTLTWGSWNINAPCLVGHIFSRLPLQLPESNSSCLPQSLYCKKYRSLGHSTWQSCWSSARAPWCTNTGWMTRVLKHTSQASKLLLEFNLETQMLLLYHII